jgi:hypothetical protein
MPDYPDGGQLGRTKAGLLLWPLGEDHIISVLKSYAMAGMLILLKRSVEHPRRRI